MAVCYKCAGEEQFNEFCEEVEQRAANQDEGASNATNDVKHVLKQIEEAGQKNENEAENNNGEIADVSKQSKKE